MAVGGNFTNCACGPNTACQYPTEPVATVGLCLSDGTPIAVTVVRDCAGVITSEGWINLATGAFTTGQPPAGTIACGDSRSIQVSGTFCDVDPGTGDVLGLVLIEYSYAADGSIASVRLVDATTGDTYTPQGEITTCPAGVEQPDLDLIQLCDTDPATGAVTTFVRDYRRDENGSIVGHADYTLAGTPYTPTGTVGVCAEPCRDSQTVLLCDVPADSTSTITPTIEDGTAADVGQGQFQNHPGPYTALWAGGAFIYPAGAGPTQEHLMATGKLTADMAGCDGASGTVTISVRVRNDGPDDGQAWDGALRLFRGTTLIAAHNALEWAPPGWQGTLTVSAPVTAADIAAGDIRVALILETYHLGAKQWTADQFAATLSLEGCEVTAGTQFLRTLVTDCETGQVVSTTDTTLDGDPYTVTGEVGQCQIGGGSTCCPPETRLDVETGDLCVIDDTSGDVIGRVLVERVYDDQTGTLSEQRIVDPATGDPVEVPAGASIGVCPPPCQDTSTLLLCDVDALDTITVLDTAGVQDSDGWQITSFTDGGCAGYNPPDGPVPGPAVWSGGYLGIRADRSLGGGSCIGTWSGYDTAPIRWVLTKTFTAAQDGMAVITADPLLADGGARVRLNGTDVGLYAQWNQPAVGGSSQVTVTAGLNVVEIEVRDVGGPNWVRGRLDIVLTRTEQFLRRTVTDCVTGQVVSVTDTTLDGQPYTVTGEVGQCEPTAQCCPPPPPETRLDVETKLLCVRDTASGDTIAQVIVERVYDDQTGTLSEQRIVDLDGAAYVLPAGAELVVCEPDQCPRSFNTQCVGIVTRSEGAYDNTSLIGGIPGQCGSVQGPNDGNPANGAYFGCTGGPYTITSWIVNGVDVIAEGGGRTFDGGPCGPGDATTPGMHLNWAQALTNLDPSGATWVVDSAPGCAFYVHSVGGTDNVYGPMTVVGDGDTVVDGTWILGAAQACEETQYTKVFTQQCDGTVTVSWLDAAGVEVAAPAGLQVQCGTGCSPTSSSGPDVEVLLLCDVAADGTSVQFLRHIVYDNTGAVAGVSDTGLDGFAPYTPTGTVGVCEPEPCASTVQTVRLCDLNPDVAPDGQGRRCAVPFLRHLVHDCAGVLTDTRDTAMDGTTPYTPVQVIDCGSGGMPAMVEVPWEVVDIQPDPDSAAGFGLIFTLSPIDDPTTVGSVRVTTNSVYNPPSCPGEPPQYNYRNPTTYTFTPDQALRDNATYVRCDLLDFDNFEPVTGLNPPPSRLGGTAYWDGTTVRPTTSNGVGEMYYDGPPASWSYRVGNTGGGNSCSALSFAAVSLRPDGCCAPCGSGDGGRTVQEVCVIANAAPDVVMVWTRVIEDGGGTIYYLDQNGDRYDATLPAGHQIVACPVAPDEPGRDISVLSLCDTAADGAVTEFLRHLYYAEGSDTPTVVDTALDGTTPYTPSGEVGVCGPAQEPCRDTSTLLLCDVAADGAGQAIAPTIVDGPIDETGLAGNAAYPLLPKPWDALWAGGTLLFPADPDPAAGDGKQVYRTVVGQITAAVPPECVNAAGSVTISLRAVNDGPNPGAGGTGWLRVWRDGSLLSYTTTEIATPVGKPQYLSVTVPVTAQDLAAGSTLFTLSLETFHGPGPKGWTVDQLAITADVAGCAVQFARTLTIDCETGAVLSVTDTTLDGQPYTVTGEVGQCAAGGAGGSDCCPGKPCTANNIIEQCRCDDTTGDGVPDTDYVELLAVDCDGTVTSVGTYTADLSDLYTPVAPVPCETAGADPATAVQAHRIQLDPGATWDAASVPLLQSVTLTAHAGTGTITTTDGASTLFAGETVTWSVVRDNDAMLVGPLTVAADTGTVTVAYTAAVTL